MLADYLVVARRGLSGRIPVRVDRTANIPSGIRAESLMGALE